jgi:hypothetical protein
VSPQRGDRFDLDELIAISEHGHTDQCARDVVSTEVAADNLPNGEKVFPILRGDVDRGFHNVGEFRSGGVECDREICHDLLGLASDIADRHGLSFGVERTSAGSEDEAAYVTRNRRVRIWSLVGEVSRSDEIDTSL